MKLDAEVATRLKAVEKLTGAAPAGDPARLLAVGDALEKREDAAQAIDRRLSALRDLRGQVRDFRTTAAPAQQARFRKHEDVVGFGEDAWKAFGIQFVGDVEGILDQAIAAATRELNEIRSGGAPENAEPEDIRTLDVGSLAVKPIDALAAERARLQQLSGMDATRAKSLRTAESRLRDARACLVECAKTLRTRRRPSPESRN